MHPLLGRVAGHAVTSYSVLTVLGYLAAALWLRSQRERLRASPAVFWSLAAALIAGALLGAKLGYFLVEREDFLADPAGMLRDWGTGWVFWPGVPGALLAGLAYQAGHNRLLRPRRYLPVADYVITALPLGHAIGRLGCFLEGCCHGRPTGLPWGVAFTSPASSVADGLLGVPLQPVALYEAAGELGLFLGLWRWLLPRVRARAFPPGTALFGYLAAYSALRFSLEFLRGDDRGRLLGAGLSPSQWLSLLAGACAAAWLLRRAGRPDPLNGSFYLDGRP